MEFTEQQILKKEIRSVAEFARELNISSSAVSYCIANDSIDYCILRGKYYIVLTTRTRSYKPNESPLRKKAKRKVTLKNNEWVGEDYLTTKRKLDSKAKKHKHHKK